jgi:hypothetical protein
VAGCGHMCRGGKFLAGQYRPEAQRAASDMVERARNGNLRAMQALKFGAFASNMLVEPLRDPAIRG